MFEVCLPARIDIFTQLACIKNKTHISGCNGAILDGKQTFTIGGNHLLSAKILKKMFLNIVIMRLDPQGTKQIQEPLLHI